MRFADAKIEEHPRARHRAGGRRRKKVFNRLLEDRLINRVSFEEYRRAVRDVYDGPQGAMLAACSFLSLHTLLGDRLLRQPAASICAVRGESSTWAAAPGRSPITCSSTPPAKAEIVCFDLSHEMLRRARMRLKSPRPRFIVADITRLPFPDASFDCVTCGYVLEHIPDARLGLAELSRVMVRGRGCCC